jgi:tRNA (uracil-5-)-methyltransferase
MKSERARVTKDISSYTRGATLLLREDTRRISRINPENEPNTAAINKAREDTNMVVEEFDSHILAKSCVTDQKGTSHEYIDDFVFENPAGAFFQNNNSILPPFTQYIRDHILPKGRPSDPSKSPLSYLIDAYSGSGLFTITLSQMFKKSIGIDISASSIEFAAKNARLNNLPNDQASFMAADAGALFAKVTFPAAETVVVIDPPRKGCDENFLSQLVRFGPERVVYVSCNVHTQARDVGMLVGGMKVVNDGKGIYEIESLRGFDFFPQTGHVEGVCVLRKKANTGEGSEEVAVEKEV